jgi:malate dehydrogenase (quinone)
MKSATHVENPDLVLIGSGIMSASLAALLRLLNPELRIQVFEANDELAQESSNGWSNAGTGHAGICELSYTPRKESDGTVNVTKAIEIYDQFEQSKQFWAFATVRNILGSASEFINPVRHVSFVHGQEQVDFLRARYMAMRRHHFFSKMQFTVEPSVVASWVPLLVEGREAIPIAATMMDEGTDVNFGAIASRLLGWISKQNGCGVATGHRVIDLKKQGAGWGITIRNCATNQLSTTRTKFVFVGAGGGTLPLLQRSDIAESKGLGGFPIGGQWLVCENPEIVRRHDAKVYGQALGAAPTMAIPHLDTRVLDGRKTLLFGPFASWTTKFLHKQGRWTDLPFSIRPDNLVTLARIGFSNAGLVRYLVQQGTQSMADRLATLRIFYPAARAEDWKLIDAGIRVQAIKKTDGEAGIVHYGTEIITNFDKSLSALLGASPGASVSVSIVLNIIRTSFPHLLEGTVALKRMKEIFPSWPKDLTLPSNKALFDEVSGLTNRRLQLQ